LSKKSDFLEKSDFSQLVSKKSDFLEKSDFSTRVKEIRFFGKIGLGTALDGIKQTWFA
jgi:hypothetical protein